MAVTAMRGVVQRRPAVDAVLGLDVAANASRVRLVHRYTTRGVTRAQVRPAFDELRILRPATLRGEVQWRLAKAVACVEQRRPRCKEPLEPIALEVKRRSVRLVAILQLEEDPTDVVVREGSHARVGLVRDRQHPSREQTNVLGLLVCRQGQRLANLAQKRVLTGKHHGATGQHADAGDRKKALDFVAMLEHADEGRQERRR